MRFLVICLLVICSQGFAIDQVYFSEKTDLSEKFIEQIGQETQSIKLATHRLSDVKVIQALIEAFRRGVDVQIIVDSVTVSKKTPLTLLTNAGMEVFIWKNDSSRKKRGSLHHSFALFGSTKVWTGTVSFSVKRLFCHKESALIFSDEKGFQEFLQEFIALKQACSYLSSN
jgi:phosphatidylserine/phosphatidylglycerophosphate/cardiolipin synthase-like enzyme